MVFYKSSHDLHISVNVPEIFLIAGTKIINYPAAASGGEYNPK